MQEEPLEQREHSGSKMELTQWVGVRNGDEDKGDGGSPEQRRAQS